MRDATVVATAEGEASSEETTYESEGEMDAVAAADIEEGAEERVGVAPSIEVEEPEVTQWCRCAIMYICPPYTFGTGKTCVLFWWERSSSQSRVMLFVRTGTCADCDGRTASVKTRTFLPPQTCRQSLPGG